MRNLIKNWLKNREELAKARQLVGTVLAMRDGDRAYYISTCSKEEFAALHNATGLVWPNYLDRHIGLNLMLPK